MQNTNNAITQMIYQFCLRAFTKKIASNEHLSRAYKKVLKCALSKIHKIQPIDNDTHKKVNSWKMDRCESWVPNTCKHRWTHARVQEIDGTRSSMTQKYRLPYLTCGNNTNWQNGQGKSCNGNPVGNSIDSSTAEQSHEDGIPIHANFRSRPTVQ